MNDSLHPKNCILHNTTENTKSLSFVLSLFLVSFSLKFFLFFKREREREKERLRRKEKREVREGEEGNISPQETVSIFSVYENQRFWNRRLNTMFKGRKKHRQCIF